MEGQRITRRVFPRPRCGPTLDAYLQSLMPARNRALRFFNSRHCSKDGTRFCEERWLRFKSSQWHVAFIRHRLGRAFSPNESVQRSIRWWRASPRSSGLGRRAV